MSSSRQLCLPSDDNGFVTCSNARPTDCLADAAQIVRIPAGRIIFRQGDSARGCYLVLKGAVKVTIPASHGREMLLAVLGKGDLVGEMALLDGLPRSATVTALKACELRYISAAAFDRLAHADVGLGRQLLRAMAGRLRQHNEAYAVQQMSVRVRLAHALLHLGQRFGESLPDGRLLIRQKLSQAELGQMIGAARENVNRQLTEWSRDRIISRISGYYCLESPSTVQCLARGHAPD
jgi:CRP/FNR family transcriptional regulator, cyclic AMP receptor protein